MRIWIDIYHIPQFNFYLPLMWQLVKNGHSVYLTILNRGRLEKICRNDLTTLNLLSSTFGERGKVTIDVLGRHRMKRWSAILEANLLRIPVVIWWCIVHHVDIAFSNGFHVALACWLTHTPNYCFGDDPQTKDYKPRLWFSRKSHYTLYELPEFMHVDQSVEILKCLKEWAYLAPNVFRPNATILDKYGVQPKQYIFLREVSVGTVNYAGQAAGAIRDVASLIANAQCTMYNGEKMKVLFSLEEKNRRSEYPADWILLQEPIEDIHSLIYYSAGLVSSGDSMAREAALLGVPAYYLGIRHSMPANLAASKVANLQNTITMPFEQWIGGVCDGAKSVEERINNQNILRDKIDHEFIDINAYMLSLVDKVAQEKDKND